jgi:hypothetical protein
MPDNDCIVPILLPLGIPIAVFGFLLFVRAVF